LKVCQRAKEFGVPDGALQRPRGVGGRDEFDMNARLQTRQGSRRPRLTRSSSFFFLFKKTRFRPGSRACGRLRRRRRRRVFECEKQTLRARRTSSSPPASTPARAGIEIDIAKRIITSDDALSGLREVPKTDRRDGRRARVGSSFASIFNRFGSDDDDIVELLRGSCRSKN